MLRVVVVESPEREWTLEYVVQSGLIILDFILSSNQNSHLENAIFFLFPLGTCCRNSPCFGAPSSAASCCLWLVMTRVSPVSPIRVGATDADSLSVSPQATRIVLLSGGTGKYAAYVADGTLAKVAINEDTLRITGQLTGKTVATIHSGDEIRRITLHVENREVSVSHQE